MHYLLIYDAVENYVTARMPYRKAHLLHAMAAHQRGEIILAGALANPATSSPALQAALPAASGSRLAGATHASRIPRSTLLPGGEGSVVSPADDDDWFNVGAVVVFQCDSPKVAEDFAKADPYVLNGVFTKWRVREWTTVVGDNPSVRVDPNNL